MDYGSSCVSNRQSVILGEYFMLNYMINHYDKLIEENNDPVHDSKPLQEYMNQWDGINFIKEMQLTTEKNVLEIGIGTGRIAIKAAPMC